MPAILAAAALAVAAAYLATEVSLVGRAGFPLDDSWIHLTFARSLAAGDGLSYRAGELVTGSTAPLWTALLSLGFLLPVSPLLWAKALGAALHAGGVWAAYRLGRELGLGRGLAALAGVLVLATAPLVWGALSGMEVPLFVFLSTWGMVLHVRERRADVGGQFAWPRAEVRAEASSAPTVQPRAEVRAEASSAPTVVFAVATLARPEGILLLALAVLDRLLCFRRVDGELALARPALRPLAIGLGLAALALVPALAFYWIVGGSPLPTTFGSKVGAARSWVPDAEYLYTVLGIFFRTQPVMVLFAGAGALALVERLGTRRDYGLLPAAWLAALPLAYSLLSPQGKHLLVGNLGRYVFPLFPPLVVLGCLGLERAAAALGPRVRAGRLALPARALAVGLLVVPTFTTMVTGAARYAQNVANVQDGDVEMARWLARHVPRDAVLAVQDIGAIGFLLPHRLVDLGGIVSPEAQGYVRRAVSERDRFGQAGMLGFLDDRRPDYLVVFPSWYPAIVERGRFRPVHRLRVEGNVTLARDEIVVYATPWTRYPLRP